MSSYRIKFNSSYIKNSRKKYNLSFATAFARYFQLSARTIFLIRKMNFLKLDQIMRLFARFISMCSWSSSSIILLKHDRLIIVEPAEIDNH